MLRSLPRVISSSSHLRATPIHKAFRLPQTPAAACVADLQHHQTRHATNHAISNPTLAGIEKRWEDMPPQEQAELWMALRDRMKGDWHELTPHERKAAYWIAFGPHGPRALPPPGEGWYVFKGTMACIAISTVLFIIIRMFARGDPSTMNEQYQKMTNEFLKAQNSEPITGVSSEGYKGKGMVQSPPRKGPPPGEDDDE